MDIRTQTTSNANVYTSITKNNNRLLFSENYYENPEPMADQMFNDRSRVKCNVCNIMRTTFEALKSHTKSTRHKTRLNQSRNERQ